MGHRKFLLSSSILINFLLLSRRLSKEPTTAVLTTLPTEEAIMMYWKIWLVLKNCLTSLVHPNITAHSKTCPQCKSGQRSTEGRTKSTKVNPGTLPVTAYSRRGLVANPSSSLSEICGNIHVHSDTTTSDDEDDCDVQSDCVPVTISCVSTISF